LSDRENDFESRSLSVSFAFHFDLAVMSANSGVDDEQTEPGAADVFVFTSNAIEHVEDFFLVIEFYAAAMI
jgi:hypothetical protein